MILQIIHDFFLHAYNQIFVEKSLHKFSHKRIMRLIYMN
ncbi:unnamed protein product [Spirodela intermedia]|uniref:Uncharacterized protein n=1 Tax=Spirodela intermedia TaxID=51605 RepID=A0A7I8IFU7_SPIIN|nr:unnamed protein product [Spirodela intermedia]CAA6656780.1 unnamed protein product [Spirodela intermedia]